MDSLFGVEVTGAARFIIAFVVVLVLIAVTAWLVRRFGGGSLASAGGRGRQPRLAVIDAANVDARRKLILVRRDNVEHLVMIGGPSDVVIEPNIIRAAPTARDLSTGRAAPIPETMPRPVPLEEAAMWPLQPESALRPQRAPAPVAAPWSNGGQHQLDTSLRAHHPDTLAELADALAAQTQSRAEPALASERHAVPRYTAAGNNENLTENAQRPQAIVRSPAAGEPKLSVPIAEPRPIEPEGAPHPAADVPAAAHPTIPEMRPVTAEPPQQGAPKKFYETIEQEMASLLGRPMGTT